jgi:ribosome biogenesis GTPase
MRELQLWDAAEGLNQTFQDIDDLAKSCRYRNCRHESEDGCAVKAAITEGDLDTARLRNYKKLQREQEFWERKADPAKLSNSKKRWKHIQKNMRQKRKFEDRD